MNASWIRRCFGNGTNHLNCPELFWVSIVPHIYFILSLPLQYFAYRQKKRPYPSIPAKIWLRIFLFFGLIITAIAESAFEWLRNGNHEVFTTKNTQNLIAVITWQFAIFSILSSFHSGRRSNGYVITYSTFQLILGLFIYTKEALDTQRIAAFNPAKIVLLVFLNGLFYGEDIVDEKGARSPYDSAGFYSRLGMTWLTSLIGKGFKKPLTLADLFPLPKGLASAELVSVWEEKWRNECQKPKNRPNYRPSIAKVLFSIFQPAVLPAVSLRMLGETLNYVNPLLLRCLIDFVGTPSLHLSFGIMCACAMFVMAEVKSLINANTVLAQQKAASGIHSLLANAIFRKTLRLSPTSRGRHTVGGVVNLLSVDVELITGYLPYAIELITCPFNIIFSLVLLYILMGPAAISGVVLMVLLIPFNYISSILIKKLQLKQLKVKDERAKCCNEVLNGIKLVKLYAWEEAMMLRINNLRAKEVKILTKANMIARLVDAVNAASPYLVAIVSFSVFILSSKNNILTPQIAFVALSIFNQLRQPMKSFALLMNYVVRALVSKRRIEDFLVEDEMSNDVIQPITDTTEAIRIENAKLNWFGEDSPSTLEIPCLNIKKGEFVAVVGAVGSGKTSLLNAILGEMCLLEGNIQMSGSIAYSAQQPWLRNENLRENITFGKPYDRKLFRRVTEAVRLNVDFEQMDRKDLTEVGDNGVTLSGGQKARVGLARALYQNAEIYLLDDVLSAVDAHVGASVFHRAMGKDGFLRGKTRILVTHSLHYTRSCDRILVMSGGKIIESGSFSELAQAGGTFARLLREKEAVEAEKVEEEPGDEEISKEIPRDKSSRRYSIAESLPADLETVKTEAVEGGSVSSHIYCVYIRAAARRWAILLISFFIAQSAFAISRSLWLSWWSNENIDRTQSTRDAPVKLAIFSALGMSEVLCLVGTQIALVIGCQNASLRLHSPLLHSILRSPMSFFDTTPLGRILNRLTTDLEVIDNLLPATIGEFLNTAMLLIVVLVMISIATPIFLFFIVPIALVYLFYMRFFIRAARQMRRLESTRRSPLISLFNQTLQGASTIRAYKKVDSTFHDFGEEVDAFIRCRIPSQASHRWLGVRLEAISATATLTAALCGVFSSRFSSLSPAMIGMSISYALNITEMLDFGIRMMSELETYIVSVERVDEYSRLESEAEWRGGEKLDPKWPQEGRIEFEDYSTRYRKELPLVIQDLTMATRAGEKVGVVGRTGSGKSSLTMALYRMIEGSGGKIKIDGIDIATIGLHDLRERLSIIPQDPVLFSGSVRFNLDPFERHTDQEIWEALETCQLKNYISSLPGKLEEQITEGGANLSVGQRQLVCLGRALLKKGKILVLDEATAACDVQTDALVQEAVKENFPQSTVLAIAHRLDTIEDYDRILVMDSGRLKEFDSPKKLLENPNSLYRSLVEKAKEEKSRQDL